MTSPARPPACAPAADDGKAPRTPAAWTSLTLSPGRKTLSRRGARMMSPLPHLVMFDLVPRAGHFKRAQVGHSCQAPKHCVAEAQERRDYGRDYGAYRVAKTHHAWLGFRLPRPEVGDRGG